MDLISNAATVFIDFIYKYHSEITYMYFLCINTALNK